MRKMAAIPIIASSAGPRPKREWSLVDELDRIMADDPSRRRFGDNNDGWLGDNDVMDREGEL